MKVLQVEWIDHYLREGWYAKDTLDTEPHINTSIGFLVKENKKYLILSMTHHSAETILGDVLYIVKKDIVSRKELCENITP